MVTSNPVSSPSAQRTAGDRLKSTERVPGGSDSAFRDEDCGSHPTGVDTYPVACHRRISNGRSAHYTLLWSPIRNNKAIPTDRPVERYSRQRSRAETLVSATHRGVMVMPMMLVMMNHVVAMVVVAMVRAKMLRCIERRTG